MLQLITEFFIFIIGASIGSFLNVLIDRLPKEEKITGRSRCDYCGKKLAWYDLIPVFSFILLKGKCRYCHKKLSWQYPIVEIITGISFILITNHQIPITKQFSIFNFQFSNIWLFGNWSLFVSWLLFLGIVSCLIVIFFSDLKYNLISDYIQVAFFIFSVFYHLTINFHLFLSVSISFLIYAFVVAFPIWLIFFISRERTMGFGDVFLAFNIGFLLGWQAGFLALYFAFVIGAVIGLFLIILKKSGFKSKIPFGPFLVLGTVIMLFWGEKIMEIIKRIYGF
jgi:leader peptidase (prepilin peptidase)/N-methyltransferase